MAITNGGAIRSVQKLSGTIPSHFYPIGSTLKTFTMPSFQVADPSNAFVDCLWYRIAGGTLAALLRIDADVTGVNQITLLVTTPIAQTLALQVGGRVIEYG